MVGDVIAEGTGGIVANSATVGGIVSVGKGGVFGKPEANWVIWVMARAIAVSVAFIAAWVAAVEESDFGVGVQNIDPIGRTIRTNNRMRHFLVFILDLLQF